MIAVVALASTWHPWQQPGRRAWSAPPRVPQRLTAVERSWLTRLGSWAGYVRDTAEDPTTISVGACKPRLGELGEPPARLTHLHELAHDTCAAAIAAARDKISSERSLSAKLVERATGEQRESSRDLGFLLAALRLRAPPGGEVVGLYSRVATRLAGRTVSARCWSSDANWLAVTRAMARTEPGLKNLAGFAVPWLSRIELSPEVCRKLSAIERGVHLGLLTEVHAIEVLTHESEHLHGADGISNEARVDCYAAQRLETTARLLGVPAARRRGMGQLYLMAEQPFLPAEYRSRECRNGGRFDLRPSDPTFP